MIMTVFAILAARLVSSVLRLFNKGATTLPGRVALYFKYDILTRLSQGVHIICVTGTNGKTTTCAMIENALTSSGYSAFLNKSGANMLTGVTTAFLQNSSVFGKCRKDFAVLECDENSLPAISRYIDADVFAVTNIFRDQLDRYGEVSHTLDVIKKSVLNMPETHLVINADCPLTYSLSLLENGFTTFGVDADFDLIDVSEARYCPVCSSELRYTTRVFSHLGRFTCDKCGFCRIEPDFAAQEVTVNGESGSSFVLSQKGKKTPQSISLSGIYNVYNYLCATAVLSFATSGKVSVSGSFSGAFGRQETFTDGERKVLLLLVKNPVGMSSCAAYTASLKDFDCTVLALNDNAADGRDVSWIWDCDFDPLCSMQTEFYTFGTRASDMTLRLKYSDIAVQNTLDSEDMASLMQIINNYENTVILANYTAMMKIRKTLRKHFGGKEFWQ